MRGYDPITTLIEEHRAFLRRLAIMGWELVHLDPTGPSRADLSASLNSFAEFLASDVAGFHERKEEEGLFPVLARHLTSEGGPVDVLLEEHGLLRTNQRTIAGNVPKLAADPQAEAWKAVRGAASEIDQLLRSHIEKEEQMLFPMARDLLTPNEMAEVTQVCLAIEEQLGSPPRRIGPV